MIGAPTLSTPLLGWTLDFAWSEEDEEEVEHVVASECRLIAVEAEDRTITVDC